MAEGGENEGLQLWTKEEAKERLRKVLEAREAREAEFSQMIDKVSEERLREILHKLADEKPTMVNELIALHTKEKEPPQPEEPKPSWCSCGNCREMGVRKANLCCGKTPAECIAKCADVEMLCLDPPQVAMTNMLWQDMAFDADDESEHRDLRYAAYRSFLLWRYGTIDGMRNGPFEHSAQVKIYSCVVWRIRDLFPDPSGVYQGWID